MKNKNYNECNLDTMAKMPDNFVDLTVTSPPYDDMRKYKGYSFQFEEVSNQLYRVTKKGGVVCWVVGDKTKNGSESLSSFRQALYFQSIGFSVETMIFQKSNGMPTDTTYRYRQIFEYIFILSKGQPKAFNPITVASETNRAYRSNWGRKDDYCVNATGAKRTVGDTKIKGNIFTYAISLGGATKDKFAFKHPAIFPEKLAEDLILSWSNEGDLVYDPFMGSGTTAKMAILNNREWIGSELSPEYCEIIKQRIDAI